MLPKTIYQNRYNTQGKLLPWDTNAVHEVIIECSKEQSIRTSERVLESSGLIPATLKLEDVRDEYGFSPIKPTVLSLETEAKKKRWLSLIVQEHQFKGKDGDGRAIGRVLFANDHRLGRRWVYLENDSRPQDIINALASLAGDKNLLVWPHGGLTATLREIAASEKTHDIHSATGNIIRIGTVAYRGASQSNAFSKQLKPMVNNGHLSHLDKLEAESIHIMREVMAQAENPVMLYSVGKDSAVMLHLAKKAFYPSPPPFPLMHVDTRWKFQAMYDFRDKMAAEAGMELIVHINPEGVEKNINPFDHGSSLHTDIMKTQGLKQALDMHKFDVAFGGARRDEEKSRAKERVFSFRTKTHRWDPKNQRPELWNLYNGYKTQGESIRVFPLSNWTELDIWQYIYREQIPIVPLYYAAERPVIERDGMLMLVDDDRIPLYENEKIQIKRIRFRTLGCYPLTGAVESDADDLSSIVLELLQSRTSEREGRAIDADSSGSMEKKKQEGYF